MADFTLVVQYTSHLQTVDSLNLATGDPSTLSGDTYCKAPSSAGLIQLNDTSPLSVTLTSDADLIDGDYYTHATAAVWSEYDSYGVDVGSPRTIGKLRIYLDPGAETFTGWYASNAPPGTSLNNYFEIYSSDDNSSWTLRLSNRANDIQTIVSADSGEVCLDIELSSPVSARYWKIRGYSITVVWILSGFHWVIDSITYGDLFTSQSHYVNIGEVEAWEYVIAADHIHTADNVALTQKHVLTVQGADHIQKVNDATNSITATPAVGGDDGYWSIDLFSSGYGVLRFGGYGGAICNTFVRFQNVAIPTGATITSAYIQFTAYENQSVSPVYTNVYFNDEDNPSAPTTKEQCNALSLTSGVAWDNIPSWSDGSTYNTPSLIDDLQSVIARPGWASGQAVIGVVKDDGSSNVNGRGPSAYEYVSGTEAAELNVEYNASLPIALNLYLAPQGADHIHAVDAIGTLKVAAPKTTDTLYPAVSNDDGTDTNNTLTTNAVSLIMGHYGGYSTSIFIRFPDVNIEHLQQVTNAFIRFTAYGAASGTTCRLRIYAVDADDAAAPTNDTEWDALTQTSAYVDWTPAVWVDDTTYDTPNIATVIQEVVNRAGWTAMSAIVVQVLDNSSDAGAYRRASSLDYNLGVQKPELHLTWISMGDTLIQTVDGSLVLVENKTLAVAGADHLHTVESPVLDQGLMMTTDSCDHLHTVDSVTIVVDLVVASCDHLHTVDDINQALRAVNGEDAYHVHAVDGSLALVQQHTLAVQGSDHIQESSAQIGPHIPAVADSDHVHTVDGITGTLLWVHPDHDEPYHIQTVESPTLTQKHTLTVQGADHLHVPDAAVVWHLVISQDAYHLQVADSIALTQQHVLTVQGSDHTHSVDSVKIMWALIVSETAMLYDAIRFGWRETVADSAAMADTVTHRVIWPIYDHASLIDTVTSKWVGSVSVTDTINILGQAIIFQVFNETASESFSITDTTSFLHRMVNTIADAMAIADTASPAITFNPAVVEAMAIAGAVEVIKKISETNAETMTVTDTIGWMWRESVSETMAATDTATIALMAMLTLTDSIALTETVLGALQVDETISDTLAFATTLAINQILGLSVTDGIDMSVKVLLGDELWETWVVNTNSFGVSVYSNFDFNSYATFGAAAYGCKDDGIYELTGTTDQGDAITSGIVLPETYFGLQQRKRFRKAYFGLSGGTTPSIRLETDSGSETYTITDSKANISRSLYGRTWTLKLEDFETTDFIELIPVILTR